jgi:DNA-binding MarR family transcriptional regulator
LPEPDPDTALYFALFREVGVLAQLSGRLLERHLPAGLLASHFGVLNHLMVRGDGATPLALARAFQVPKTTMTHTLAGLERAGLVLTSPNPADGRSKRVTITESGRRLRNETVARLAPDFAGMAALMAPDRVAAALPVLVTLREHLDRERDRVPPVM